MLPTSVTLEIDQINRNFLWGISDTNKRPHLLKWSKVCLSKDRGGLGLRQACMTNSAVIVKLGWRVLCNDFVPWARSFTLKYLKLDDFWNASKRPSNSPL